MIYLPRSLRIVRKGIARRPSQRTASGLPLTEPQAQVLAVLDADLRSAAWITAEVGGRTQASVVSSLYALEDRGLAERVPYKGWRRP